jgi:hypothetical protein
MRLTRLTVTSFFAVLLASASASAESTPASAPASDDPTAGLKGFELMLRPSFGGASSDSPVRFQPSANVVGDPGALLQGAKPWGPGFVGQASVGYRFLRHVGAGLRGGIRTASSSSISDGSSNLSRFGWDAGFYVRAYPLAGVESIAKYVDPWIGTGIGYMHDSQILKRNLAVGSQTVTADETLQHHAVAIPFAIGVDYRVARVFSVGPSFEYTLASAVVGCAKTEAAGFQPSSYCSNGDNAADKAIKANSYGVWSAGLDAKVTF